MKLTRSLAESLVELSGSPHFRRYIEALEHHLDSLTGMVLDSPSDQVDLRRGHAREVRNLLNTIKNDAPKVVNEAQHGG